MTLPHGKFTGVDFDVERAENEAKGKKQDGQSGGGRFENFIRMHEMFQGLHAEFCFPFPVKANLSEGCHVINDDGKTNKRVDDS